MPNRPKWTYCSRCNKLKRSTKDFALNQYNKGSKPTYRTYCKECAKKRKPIPTKKRKEYEATHPRPTLNKKFICPICKRSIIPWDNRQICLDHNYKTGEIRGWLCGECNSGMGRLLDNVDIMKRAILWIEGKLH